MGAYTVLYSIGVVWSWLGLYLCKSFDPRLYAVVLTIFYYCFLCLINWSNFMWNCLHTFISLIQKGLSTSHTLHNQHGFNGWQNPAQNCSSTFTLGGQVFSTNSPSIFSIISKYCIVFWLLFGGYVKWF